MTAVSTSTFCRVLAVSLSLLPPDVNCESSRPVRPDPIPSALAVDPATRAAVRATDWTRPAPTWSVDHHAPLGDLQTHRASHGTTRSTAAMTPPVHRRSRFAGYDREAIVRDPTKVAVERQVGLTQSSAPVDRIRLLPCPSADFSIPLPVLQYTNCNRVGERDNVNLRATSHTRRTIAMTITHNPYDRRSPPPPSGSPDIPGLPLTFTRRTHVHISTVKRLATCQCHYARWRFYRIDYEILNVLRPTPRAMTTLQETD